MASYAGAPSLRFKALEFPNSAFSAKEKEDGEKKKKKLLNFRKKHGDKEEKERTKMTKTQV